MTRLLKNRDGGPDFYRYDHLWRIWDVVIVPWKEPHRKPPAWSRASGRVRAKYRSSAVRAVTGVLRVSGRVVRATPVRLSRAQDTNAFEDAKEVSLIGKPVIRMACQSRRVA